MIIIPREYQEYAIGSLFDYFGNHNEGNPIIAMPTGSGKAVVIAVFIERVLRQWPDQNILITTHVKELVQQNYNKMLSLWPDAPAGIFSSGLRRHDLYKSITFSGIGSIYRKASLFAETDIMIIDECDLVSPDQASMYLKFINALKEINPYLRVIGLTATPWRSKHGILTDGEGIFTDICFDMTSPEAFVWLIDEGYLVPLIPKRTKTFLDPKGVKTTAGEFNQKQLQAVCDVNELTRAALEEICQLGKDRNSWLMFCTGIEHSIHTAEILNDMQVPCGVVHSGNKKYPMDTKLRDSAIKNFELGITTGIANNSILGVGYDNPAIDLIGHLKPEKSSRSWVQELGRGTRPLYAPGFDLTKKQGRLDSIYKGGKHNCLVLDYGRNTPRLGPINDPIIPKLREKRDGPGEAPVKDCPQCESYIPASARFCPHCEFEFQFIPNLARSAGTEELIVIDSPKIDEYKVDFVTYSKHISKRNGSISLKVTYFCMLKHFTEYIHIENPKSCKYIRLWWVKRSPNPIPKNVDEALAQIADLKKPKSISVWVNKDYPEIVKHVF